MRAFLISLTLHLTFFLFITYSFKDPFETIQSKFLGVNIVSFSETSSSPGDVSPESEEKKIDIPAKKKKEKEDIKKESVIEKKPPKKTAPPKVEKESPSSSSENSQKSQVSQDSSHSELTDSESNSDSENFISDSSGGRIASSQNMEGLSYTIIRAPNPSYPVQAKRVKISENVVIKTRFIIGLDGRVEKIEILEGTENFGFRNEVKKALRQWQFSPVEYKGKKIKIYFYKDFIFNLKNG
ncbi:MAG: energy transducer TonB [Fusobacteriaceae bacterium]